MQSEAIDLLATALAKAQAVMESAEKNKVNPHFKSKYADLVSIIDAVRKPLTDNGLAFTQFTEVSPEGFNLITMLMHSSGQWLRSEYPLPMNATPQAIGSALTYARRYELSAITGIAADEDDDANAASTATTRKAPIKPAAKPEAAEAVKPTVQKTPHEIPRPAGIKAVDWGGAYINAIKTCETLHEVDEWAAANEAPLVDLAKMAPQVYDRVTDVEKTRREQLGGTP